MAWTKSTPKLDTVLKTIPGYNVTFAPFDVGVEVELEGIVYALHEVIDGVNWWVSKHDSSLRDGYEYVLHRPVSLSELPMALDELDRGLTKMKPKTSIRTSTHIHVNVLNKTIQEIYQGAFFYYLIEELLVRSQPKERIGNLFCLRMSDAATLAFAIENSIKNKSYFKYFNNEEYFKYSALNFCPVSRFGSLEFRIFPAMFPLEIQKWATLCHEIIDNGSKLGPDAMLQMYDDLPVKDFLARLLPKSKWFFQSKTSEYLNECLHVNYDRLRDLARVFQRDIYQIPKTMWNDDTEVPVQTYQEQVYAALYGSDIDFDAVQHYDED